MSRTAGSAAAGGTDVATPTVNPTLQYYEENAPAYALMTNKLNMAPELAEFVGMLRPGGTVLDAGCGAGRDLLAFREAGLTAIGLDLSPSLAQIARGHSGCDVLVGDLRDPPFESATFDGLWAAASLLHFDRAEIPKVLATLRRQLVPSGLFFASVKSRPSLRQADDGRRFTYFAADEWQSLLEDVGFSIVSLRHEGSGTCGQKGWIQSFARA